MLSIQGARKSFGGVIALDDANLEVRSGEIHALLGENGAGKSTLLKALAGVHRLDAGEIVVNDRPFRQGNTRTSRDQGVAVIYQEPSLFPDLTLAENVFVGRQPTGRCGVDWAAMRSEAAALFAQLGVPLDPSRRAKGLSIADQQIVEIAKALSIRAQVIVMDEPTAALSSAEADRLFAVARRLRDRGAAVVFVSHRLDEVFALCDRLTVMRDGATVASADVASTNTAQIVRWMVGRELGDLFPKVATTPGGVVLDVDGLCREGQFHEVSFQVRAGEIVALAGLVGSGRSEVARAVFGIDRYDRGSVRIGGKALPAGDPHAAMREGIALVPEDRRLEGLFMPASIATNASVTVLDRLRRHRLLKLLKLLKKADERALATEWAARMHLRYEHIDSPVERLSGGNQQKVVLAKWLATDPKMLIVDEPTRGIDVATKAEVHRLLSEQAANGLAVLMISSELPEVLGMADRVLVMREGEVVTELSRAEATQELVMEAATRPRERAPA